MWYLLSRLISRCRFTRFTTDHGVGVGREGTLLQQISVVLLLHLLQPLAVGLGKRLSSLELRGISAEQGLEVGLALPILSPLAPFALRTEKQKQKSMKF